MKNDCVGKQRVKRLIMDIYMNVKFEYKKEIVIGLRKKEKEKGKNDKQL